MTANGPALKLYNTMTRAKEAFRPLDPANVRLYVCGPTVYDAAHIGNARPLIVFDLLFRLLRHRYGEAHVTYVRNVTDVDDKINARAFERWTRERPLTAEIRALTDGTLAAFREDVAKLGVLPPTHEPRATDFICSPDKTQDMVEIIRRLVERGHAYEAEGHVLFDVPSMPDYGALSRRPRDELIAGARIEVAPFKRDPADFVLWKPSDRETEPGWESPWGYGRPGWHIECSAMAGSLLGEVFDIHGGGLDLIFPHHENEIAQSRCAFGTPALAQVWMHNGFLQVEGEKMSKSLGNFVTLREVLADWPGEVVRLAMLRTHYRQPIDWTLKALGEAEKNLDRWRHMIAGIEIDAGARPVQGVVDALADDLNTPAAITELHACFSSSRAGAMQAGLSRLGWDISTPVAASATVRAAGLLGLNLARPDRRDDASIEVQEHVSILIEKRSQARKQKNWAESDRVRDDLLAIGVALKDNQDGTTSWEIKR